MLLITLIALILALVVYIIHIIRVGGDNLNAFIVVPLLGAIILTGFFEYKWWGGEQQGSHLVSYSSNTTNSSLQCQRLEETIMDTKPSEISSLDKTHPHVVKIKYLQCNDLINWLQSDKLDGETSNNQVNALHLLLFESMKIAGASDKAQAECQATNKLVEVAMYAGASKAEAERMLEVYETNWYPQLDPEYKNPTSC